MKYKYYIILHLICHVPKKNMPGIRNLDFIIYSDLNLVLGDVTDFKFSHQVKINNTLVSGNAGDEKKLHLGDRKFIFLINFL